MPHSPTPLVDRKLDTRGDSLEQLACHDGLQTYFPEYATLWGLLIWDVTARDFPENNQGKLRTNCRASLRELAEAHYTFLRSWSYCRSLLQIHNITLPGADGSVALAFPIEPYYSNERLLNFYLHLARCRDMIWLVIECIGRVALDDEGHSLRVQGGQEFDMNKVDSWLSEKGLADIAQPLRSWATQVQTYRNQIHMRAHATVFVGSTQFVPRPNHIGAIEDWNNAFDLYREHPDYFIEAEMQMKDHADKLMRFARKIWGGLITLTEQWRSDPDVYAAKLSLPA